MPREQRVAEALRHRLPRRAERALVAIERREDDGLARFERDAGRIGELLQRDDVRVQLADDRRDAIRIVTSVGPDARVHVVGRDPESRALCRHQPNSARRDGARLMAQTDESGGTPAARRRTRGAAGRPRRWSLRSTPTDAGARWRSRPPRPLSAAIAGAGRSPCRPCRSRTGRGPRRRADELSRRSPPTPGAARPRRPRRALPAAGRIDTIAGSSTASARPARSPGRPHSRSPPRPAIRAARPRPPRTAPNTTPAAIASSFQRDEREVRQHKDAGADPERRRQARRRLESGLNRGEFRAPDERRRRRCDGDGHREHDRRESRGEGNCARCRVDRRDQLGRPTCRTRSARPDRPQPAAPPTAALGSSAATRSGPACVGTARAHR